MSRMIMKTRLLLNFRLFRLVLNEFIRDVVTSDLYLLVLMSQLEITIVNY